VSVLAALSFADRRALSNTVRTLRRRPGRLVFWSLYIVAMLGVAVMKLLPYPGRTAPTAVTIASRDFWVCGVAIAFGAALATGSARWLGAFSSRAEALVITRAAAPPLLVAAYLQVRAMIVAVGRGAAQYAYLILITLPSSRHPGALLAQLAFFAASGAAIMSVPLPRALARGPSRAALIVAGTAIMIAAAIPLALDGLRVLALPETAVLLAGTPAVHPGEALDAIAAGAWWFIAIPLAVAACASGAFVTVSRDAYPELYELSVANIEQRTARGRRPMRKPYVVSPEVRAAARRGPTRTWMRGALALLWIDTLMFRRRVSLAVCATIVGAALLAGVVLALVTRRFPALGASVGVTAVPTIMIALASTAGVRLTAVLRMPLFWLGGAPLASRLTAWIAGGLWRDILVVSAGALGYAALTRDARGPAILVVAIATLLALTRAVGVAVFAMLPNPLDQYGPAVMLRGLLFIALLAPPAVAAGFALAFTASLAVSLLTAGLIALAEAAVLLRFAASRLAGGIDRLSTAPS
jgi:hypothetical protein